MISKKRLTETLLRRVILEMISEDELPILWHRQMGRQAEWQQELLNLVSHQLPHKVTTRDIEAIKIEWIDVRNAYNLSIQLDPELFMRDVDSGFVRRSDVTGDLWSQFEEATGRGRAIPDIHPRKDGLVAAVETAIGRTISSLRVSEVALRHLEVNRKIVDMSRSEGLRVELQISVPSHETATQQQAVASVWQEFRHQLKIRGADIVKYWDRLGRERDISKWSLNDPGVAAASREEFSSKVPYAAYIEEVVPEDMPPSGDLEGEDTFRF